MQIEFNLGIFYAKGDERRFFQGLSEITAVKKFKGVGQGLIVTINTGELTKVSTREFIALLWRYGISLSCLRALADKKDFLWLKNEQFYWYKSMFEESAV